MLAEKEKKSTRKRWGKINEKRENELKEREKTPQFTFLDTPFLCISSQAANYKKTALIVQTV